MKISHKHTRCLSLSLSLVTEVKLCEVSLLKLFIFPQIFRTNFPAKIILFSHRAV